MYKKAITNYLFYHTYAIKILFLTLFALKILYQRLYYTQLKPFSIYRLWYIYIRDYCYQVFVVVVDDSDGMQTAIGLQRETIGLLHELLNEIKGMRQDMLVHSFYIE